MSEQNLNENNDDMSLNSAEENFNGADAVAVADDDSGERYETLEIAEFEDDGRETMIKVDHVSMEFNMASEKLNNLKEYAISLAKGNLFFESFKALDDISFEVKRGDVFGILGTNGSGKSTLLKIIAGVLSPTSGKCEINGNIAPLIELGAGFDMDLSARENIYLNGSLLGYSKKFIDQHFDEIVEFAEIEKFLDMPMKNYSSGMIARIAFAIATVIVPEILIVDEVLSVGDFMFQQKCEDRINDLINNHGVTVLLVSHSNDQIERLCNKAIWIEKGHTRILGEAPLVCDTYRVLAGKLGSLKSEMVIFGALKRAELDNNCLSRIKDLSAANPVDAGIKHAKFGWENPLSALLVPMHTHGFAVSFAAIAGYFQIPILPYSYETAISDINKISLELQLEKVFVVGRTDKIEHLKTTDFLNRDLYLEFMSCNPDCQGIREYILDFGFENHLWKHNFCYAGGITDYLEALAILPYCYSRGIPFLIFREDETGDFAELFNICIKSDLKRIIPVGQFNDSLVYTKLIEAGFRRADENFSNFSTTSRIANYLIEQLGTGERYLQISGIESNAWQSLFSFASTAGYLKNPLLLTDFLNTDDVVEALMKSTCDENNLKVFNALNQQEKAFTKVFAVAF